MNVVIIVTKTCNHRPILEQYLEDHGIPYDVKYAEEHPQLINEHDIRRSPNLMVDGEVAFRGMPTVSELDKILQLDRS